MFWKKNNQELYRYWFICNFVKSK